MHRRGRRHGSLLVLTVVAALAGVLWAAVPVAIELRDRHTLLAATADLDTAAGVTVSFDAATPAGALTGTGAVRGDVVAVTVGDVAVVAGPDGCRWPAGEPPLLGPMVCRQLRPDARSARGSSPARVDVAAEVVAALAGDGIDVDRAGDGWRVRAAGPGVDKLARLLRLPAGPVTELDVFVRADGTVLSVVGDAATAFAGPVHVDATVTAGAAGDVLAASGRVR